MSVFIQRGAAVAVASIALLATGATASAQHAGHWESGLEPQLGLIFHPASRANAGNLNGTGLYAGLRYDLRGPTDRVSVILNAGGSRTGAKSSSGVPAYTSYELPFTGGIGYRLRQRSPSVQVALHAGMAYKWVSPGETAGGSGTWQNFVSPELVMRYLPATRRPAPSLAVRLHSGSRLSTPPSVVVAVGAQLP